MKTLTIYDFPGVFVRLAGAPDHGVTWATWLQREAARIGKRREVEIVTDKGGRIALAEKKRKG